MAPALPTLAQATTVSSDHALDAESQTTWIVSVLTVACVLSTAAVLARLCTRACILHTFGADDLFMAAAQVFTLGTAATIFSETANGLGRHTWLITTTYVPYMKSFYSSIVIYNVGICILKMSILLQYRRIFKTPLMQKLTLGGLLFGGVWALTLSVLLPLICWPVAAFWDASIDGRCLNQLAIWYVMAALNLITDFVVFSLPLPVVKNLKLPKKQKVMLMGIFCLGFCTCIISVYRITTLEAAASSVDPFWQNTDAAVWSLLELAIGVLAACLPTLKPLIAMALPRLFKTMTPTSHGARYKMESRKSTIKGAKAAAPFPYGASGSMYLKEVDDDMDALNHSWRMGSEGRDIEMRPPGYNVSVTAGARDGGLTDHGGIQTITVLTQRVDSL